MKARELITTARKSALAHLGDEEAMAVLQLTDMVKRFIALADEFEEEADDGERSGWTEDQVYRYAAKRIREILEET